LKFLLAKSLEFLFWCLEPIWNWMDGRFWSNYKGQID
jgi:hypothetical protein